MTNPALSLLIASLLVGLGAALFWPQYGLIPNWRKARQLTDRILGEDALKHIHKCNMDGRRPTVESIAGALQISVNEAATVLSDLQSQSLLHISSGEIQLTPDGRDSALHIIRAHRLWERYLAEETGYAEAEWHGQAEQFEHRLTPAQLAALEAQLNYPTHDPHGDPIPTAAGELVEHGGRPLTTLPADTPGQIVHLEDEPELIYAQLVAEGLHVGMPVRITEITPQRIRFWANGDEHVLAPIVAGNISVVPLPAAAPVIASSSDNLAQLHPGEMGEVTSISPACRGAERRRFMDLGILPGTQIRAEMRSPGGDPTAYIIRGAMIALRRTQAEHIKIKRG